MTTRSSLRRPLAGALAACCIAAPASAAEDDFNVWAGQFVTVDLGKDRRWFVRGEAQERFTEDARRMGQLLLRSLVGYRLSDRASLGAGHGYVRTDPSGPARTHEHRLYQELNLRLVSTGGGVTLDSRSRLEQRMVEGDSETGWRYRLFLQLRAPVSGHNKLVVYTEPFIGLNETRFNPRGLAVWRNFAGVSIPLAKGMEMVPGYLNQYVARDGPDRMDHAANVNVFVTF